MDEERRVEAISRHLEIIKKYHYDHWTTYGTDHMLNTEITLMFSLMITLLERSEVDIDEFLDEFGDKFRQYVIDTHSNLEL